MASVQAIYVAIFGRPADPGGLAFFNQITENGANLAPMLNVLAGEFEYQSRFEGLDDEGIITEIYKSLFGREPDSAGLSFFLEELAAGRQTIATIAVNIMDGASGSDAAIVANKVMAADAFTATLDTPEEIDAYQGAVAAARAAELLKKITSDPATVPSSDEIAVVVRDITFPDDNLAQDDTSGGGGGGGGGGGPTTPPGPSFPHHFEGEDASHGVTGRAEPNSTVFVYDNSALIGSAPVDANGEWSFVLPSDDPFSITTRVNNAAGLGPVSGTAIIGTPGDDVLVAPDGVFAHMYGRAGNDILTGANVAQTEIFGGEGDNHLIAGAGGTATFHGGPGEDTFEGGEGFDDVWYAGERGGQGIVVNLATGIATDTYGSTDTLININGIGGSIYDDVMTGSDANEIFRPHMGNNVIDGGVGGDRNEIHYGTDWLINRVEVDLAEGKAIKYYDDGLTQEDELSNIQGIRGTAGNDELLGDDNNNWIRGLAGDDIIDGRGGYNFADYSQDFRYDGTSGVTVNLSTGTAIDGFGGQDTLINIQGIIGTQYADELIGDDGNNYLFGGGGADVLTGGGGDDLFAFSNALDSNIGAAGGPTSILDFRSDGNDDKIHVINFVGDASGNLIERSGSISLETFAADVRDILADDVDENFAALVHATSGGLEGKTYLIIDDGSGAFESGTDLVIELAGTSVTSGLSADWFFGAA